jgi:hypothetical protein
MKNKNLFVMLNCHTQVVALRCRMGPRTTKTQATALPVVFTTHVCRKTRRHKTQAQS